MRHPHDPREFAIERATTSAATIAVSAEAAVTARIFTSSPMWNITQPESRTAPSGKQHREEREPDELESHRRKQPEQVREREPDGERRAGHHERGRDHGTSL